MGFCGNFFIKIFHENLLASEIFPQNENIWKSLQRGDFVPNSFLTLKKPLYFPEIWQDDASELRFVSQYSSLANRDYRPKDLVSLAGENINEAGRVSQVRAIAKPSILAMASDFREYFGEPLVAISAFRSAEYQQRLWDLGRCDDGTFCAKPGFSEHQLGLAVDFFDATSETEYLTNPRYKAFYEWMKKNAHKYGWTQSYKHGVDVDGYEVEPWHWRYVGVERATFLYSLNLSQTSFLQKTKIFSQL